MGGALRLWTAPPLPQLCPLSLGPGVLPRRPTERVAPPQEPSVSPPFQPVLPGHSPHPSREVGASSLCLQVPRCPLGRPPRQGGLRTALHFQSFPSWVHLGLGLSPPPTLRQGPRGATRRKESLPAPTRTLIFSLDNIFFVRQVNKLFWTKLEQLPKR